MILGRLKMIEQLPDIWRRAYILHPCGNKDLGPSESSAQREIVVTENNPWALGATNHGRGRNILTFSFHWLVGGMVDLDERLK